MNKFKKAISVGMSAALLASLFTVIAAGSVFATTTVVSAGSVPRGGTSTGTVTITLTENSATCLAELVDPVASTITINDIDGGDVTWSGTPVVSAPGSLDATATIAADVLTVDTDDSSDAVQEQIIITGLTIKAASTATPGAIAATLDDNTAGDGTGGPNCWTATTRTATGTVSVGIAATSTSVIINVSGSCQFVVSAGAPGPLSFATLPETVEITVAGALDTPGAGQQTLGIDATENNHQLGESVSQADVPISVTCPATLSSPGTVVDALEQTATSVGVFPGENNQPAGTTTVSEANLGFLGAGTVVTFTLTAGVLFSGGAASPTIDEIVETTFLLTSTTCAVSVDRKSCTATVDTAETVGLASFILNGIFVDLAATVPQGTAVHAVVTTSPTKLVNITSDTIASVSRVIVGVAATPTIFINQNDQQTGQISLTEQGAGFFTAGPGPTNVFGVCLQSGESFTRAPWAVVTAGDLKLFSGLVGAASSKGTLFNSNTCARWAVFSASTAASTIEIRGTDASDVVLASGALNGPRVNVPAVIGSDAVTPGPTLVDVLIGTLAEVTAETGLTTRVSNAVRAFKSGLDVVALAQPVIAQGATGLAGSIRITETLAGQFKRDQQICVTILPRTSTTFIQQRQDTFLATANQNQLPVVSTNVASGLLASRGTPGDTTVCFVINQQAVGTLGELTISNLNFTTLADAPFGPILVRVTGDSESSAVAFEAVVSNARVGNPNAGHAATRLGVTQVGAFTISTKIAKVRHYVTYRFDFGVGAAGQTFKIWGATKTGNDWSAFSVVTARVANASGVVYYYIRQNSPTWKSYRAQWTGGGVFTPARQARWIS